MVARTAAATKVTMTGETRNFFMVGVRRSIADCPLAAMLALRWMRSKPKIGARRMRR
jgi:hypothetical protein